MYFDCHTHSHYSHDAPTKLPLESCMTARAMGLKGIAFTEHCDLRVHDENHCIDLVYNCLQEVEELKKQFEPDFKVFAGVELSDVPYRKDLLKRAVEMWQYDVMLASVHLIEYKGKILEPAVTDFSSTCIGEVYEMLEIYYEDVRKTVYECDFNILCHLTYPLRYFNAKYHKNVSLDRFMNVIEDTLKVAIQKGTALEINTARASKDILDFCPDKSFALLYKNLGGTRFTLGSDSHVVGTEGNMFHEATDMLKSIGIDKCCYFEKGKAHFYSI